MLYRFEDYSIDSAGFELLKAGQPVAIEPQVFELLLLLVANSDRALTKDEVLDHVWKGRIVSEATLSSRIKAARQAIGDDGTAQRLIRTIHGRGFRFHGHVAAETELGAAVTPIPLSRSAARQAVRYCRAADGALLAYAVSGGGAPLVKAANWLSHLEYEWQSPVWGHWWHALSQSNMLVRFDGRGVGLSDWDVDDVSFEALVRDLEAVVDSAGLERFALLGVSQGCATCIAYAAKHPERVSAMILYGGYAAGWQARGDPIEIARRTAMVELIRTGWGLDNPAFRQVFTSLFVPDATPEQTLWFNDLARITTSPDNAVRLQLSFSTIDVTHLLTRVKAPTLVLHLSGDAVVPLAAGRTVAAGIPNAEFVVMDGSNHIILETDPSWPRFVSEVRTFLSQHQNDPSSL